GASLYFMKRFWIDTMEAELALPALPPRAALFGTSSNTVAAAMQHAASAAPLMTMTALLACAYALIYGLAGRILLVFGEFALLGAAATAFGVAVGEMAGIGAPLILLVIGLMVCLWSVAWAGGVTARAVFVPVMQRSGQHVLIISIGLAIFLAEAVRLAQGSGRRWLSPVWNEPVPLLHAPAFAATMTPAAAGVTGIALLLGLGLLIAMRISRFGLRWRAAADDALAASLMGVDLKRVAQTSFVMAAGLAALTGFLLSVHLGGMGFSGGAVFGLKALVGAILGGIGSIGGAWLGGLCVGLIEAVWSAYFPIEWRDVAVFVLLAIILGLRPGGFFGYRDLMPRRV
ncbi:MAG: ABC transporter permease subunit, partial [Beijerinckiaceae bacterium]